LLYILSGQDDFSLHQAVGEIKRGIGDQAMLAVNTTTLEGQQTTLDQLKTICDVSPFLAEKRLVIIKGLLERFEPKGKSSRRQKKSISIPDSQNEYKSWAAYIGEIPDTTTLVLIDGKIRSDNPLLRELSDKAEIRSFPLLKETRLRQWIQSRVAKEGSSISPQAVDLLAKLVGSNLWIISNEIDKLILFTAGRRIEEEDVKMVVSYAQQDSIFALVDAVLESKAGLAERLLQQLLQRGASSTYPLAMLSQQLQLIVRAKELRNQRKSQPEIQNKLGLTSEFALRKTLEQANMYPWERLKEVYHKLLEADLSIKTGKYDDELALNILITELCQWHKV